MDLMISTRLDDGLNIFYSKSDPLMMLLMMKLSTSDTDNAMAVQRLFWWPAGSPTSSKRERERKEAVALLSRRRRLGRGRPLAPRLKLNQLKTAAAEAALNN